MAQPAGSAKRRKRTGGCPLPYRIHFEKQDPADSDQPSGSCFVSAPCSLVRHPPSWQAPGTSCFPTRVRIPGRAAMPSAGHGAILRFRSKKSGRIRAFRLQISSQNCQNSAPPEAPCCTLHFVLRFPVIPPDVLSALALLHPAQDLGARSRIPFLLLRQVRDVQQIPGFRRRRTPFPAGKVSLIEGSHRLLHLRYFLRRPKGQRLPRSCHLRSCNSQQKALSRTAFAMERSGRYSGISIAWVA